MSTKFIAIAALGKNREIGLHGKIPWNIPEEYEHFKRTVQGQTVLVGRKNFEQHGEQVAGTKKALVLSKTNSAYFQNINQVLEYTRENEINVVYVIGGAEIYNLTLPYISEFLCTIVDYEGPADAYFPEYLFYEWEVIDQEIHEEWTLYHMKKTPDILT